MNEEYPIVRRIELLVDIALTVLTFTLVWRIAPSVLPETFTPVDDPSQYYLSLMLIIIIWYVTLDFMNIRGHYGRRITAEQLSELLKGVGIGTVILIVMTYLSDFIKLSLPLIFLFSLCNLATLTLARLIIYRFVTSRRKYDVNRYLLIIGSKTTAQELIRLTQNDRNIKVIGCIELEKSEVGREVGGGVKVIGTMEDLRTIIMNQVVDEVIITMPLNEIRNSEWYLSCINSFGIVIRIIPQWYMRKFMTIHASHTLEISRFLSEPALIVNRLPESQDALAVKSIIDYSLALVVLIVTSPLFVIFPLLIKAFSPGPVFFKQIRCGRYGRRFPIFKFRTMVVDAEEQQYSLIELNEADGPVFKIKKDPRIIPFIGTFLRKFGLDELPQFINVIRGEMSVVGPRPPTPNEVEKYELWQRRRLSMKPGITCIWQIQPHRNEVTFEEWMNMDMYYIDHWSLWLDFKIILKTIPAVLLGQGR